MKTIVILIISVCQLVTVKAQTNQILKTDTAILSFYSKTPLEDIEATSKNGASAFNLQSGEIIVKIRNNSFKFAKRLMQEHFNENYMESNKYPISTFRGVVLGAEKLKQDGHYELPVSGTLQIHGVSRPFKKNLSFTVIGRKIAAQGVFDVKLADHNIQIPSIVGKKIAEIVQITVHATFAP